MVKKLFGFMMFGFLLAPTSAHAAACPVDDFQFYIDNYSATGCTIGDKTFTGFNYSSSGNGVVLDAASITVNPLAVGDLGFLFNGSWNVPPGTNIDSLIGYTVIASSATIHDLFLSCNCATDGPANASVVEHFETGNGQVGTLLVFSNENGQQLTDHIVFDSPTTSVTVTKDIGLSALGNGSAHISSVVNRFSQIPEPATMSLFGLGLLGLAAARRRNRNRKG